MARVKSKIAERPLLKRKVGRPKGSKNKTPVEKTESKGEEKPKKVEKKAAKKPKEAKKAEVVAEADKFAQLIIRVETEVKDAYRQACEENMRTMSQQTIYLVHSFLRAEKKRKREEEG
jgi:hypothetical protein